ncbi:PH domain-like protein [Rhizopus microsporus var. microsporus]|uniref:PH domain-like protein n=1 Tax=Rhizopus microsporus var. microsporus TaxID=86635 RepID=A0A1X0R5S4_RHIZD|nr:PH domain-like protein [Rhizopus microsporus var. microsporus]
MSSPPESMIETEESAMNKKRGRAQSVEPTFVETIDEKEDVQENVPSVTATKKTKRDEEDNGTPSVSTIRRNMKEMSTTDNDPSDDRSIDTNDSQEDEDLDVSKEEEVKTATENKVAAQFGGKNDDDDWGEFAEEESPSESNQKKDNTTAEKPKYAFGASSGFGTKGWAATHQTIPTTTKPAFGGFSNFGFGGFKATTTTTTNNGNKESSDSKEQVQSALASTTATAAKTTTTTTTTTSPFASFAKATVSPFMAAAAAAANASSSLKNASPSSASNTNGNNDDTEKEPKGEGEEDEDNSFGKEPKVKVPGITQKAEVKTGEEDEHTIFQTKAKLLILDGPSGNWKERGVGTFRINVKEENKSAPQARLVMRTDSVYRLILNLLLFEGMKVFIMQEKFVRFAGFEKTTKEDGSSDTKLVNFALKLSNPSVAKEVYETIMAHVPTKNE